MVNGRAIWGHGGSPDEAKRNPGYGSTESILGGKDPVTAGLQADDLAGLEFPIPGGVDLDHGLALATRERDLRPLDRAERPDMAHRAPQRAGSPRPDLHVVAADEPVGGAR